MRRFKARFKRRPPLSEAERGWLGAEALPGGALPQTAAPSGAQGPETAAPGNGLAAWLAAALHWARRGRAT
jgi:hypothetical protein